MPEDVKKTLSNQFSGKSWQARLLRAVTVGLGYMLGIGGMTEASWTDVPEMMGPAAVFGLIIAVVGATFTGN